VRAILTSADRRMGHVRAKRHFPWLHRA